MSGKKINDVSITGTEILERSGNPFFVVSTLFCYEVEQVLATNGLRWKKDWISLH
jgi:hypothetical protein